MGVITLSSIYDGHCPEDEIEFLYKLLGERKVAESISHKRHPTYAEHAEFVRSRPYLNWYIIYDEDMATLECVPLGTCYITKYREVGIWLMPDAKGRGAGKEAMRQLLAMHPGRVFTNTSIHNDGAFAFYSKLGFRHCANMLEHDNDGVARSSDSSSEVKQQQVASESFNVIRGHSRFGLDPPISQSS